MAPTHRSSCFLSFSDAPIESRNSQKLEKINIRLQSEHKNVQSMTAALNASTFTSQQIDDLVVDGLDLYPFVNNVGGGVKF